jgi:hypothetical protein
MTAQEQQVEVVLRHAGLDNDAQRDYLSGKLRQIFQAVLETEPAKEAQAKLDAANQRVARLQNAHRELNGRTRKLGAEQRQLQAEITETLIAAPDADLAKPVRRLEASVAENRAVLRSIEQIVEVEEFNAKAQAQVLEAELNELVARDLDEQSLARLQKAQQLASSVLEEQGEISISAKTSLSGNLQAMAIALRQRAASCRNESAELLKRRDQIADAATSSMRGRNYGGF